MAMRIAIDYTAATRQAAGIGNYVRSLVDAMLAQDDTNQYTLLTSGRPPRERPFPSAENVRGRSLIIPDRYLNVLWYRWRLPISATFFTGQVDIYHGPDFVLPPLNGKLRKVVTVHDLAFLEHPEYAVPELAAYLKKVVPEAVEAADVVASVSQTTRQTLIEHFQTPLEKIKLVPNGIRAYFRRITDPVLLEATRHKFGLKSPLVLGVGTQEPRKNHLGLIKAFHKAVSTGNKSTRPAMLALAGGSGWLYEETEQIVAELKLEKKVRFLGRVSDLELMMLYSLADVFVFPSFYEGFGVPPLEAMACGTPVITSNTSSLPEVVGDAAIMVNPHKINEIASAINRVLENKQLQEDLRQKGYTRAAHFTWVRSAQKMLSIYTQLYEGKTQFNDEVEEFL
ncbi:MAG: glycosyltransferase family 4 protein [Chloroflexi bacterium]|nr:MAG: glycosyltransferase family 4 protein [Chloroflexota bacterium]